MNFRQVLDMLKTMIMVTSSRNCTRLTLLCLWIFPPRQQNLIFDRCRSNYTQLDRELSFFRIDDASLNVTMTHQESPHGHGSYLLLFIVVSRVLDVVDILELLICPRTELCPYDSRRHFNISLCVFAIPCTVCQEEHMLKHSCLWLRTAYILRYNVTAITSKHQKSVK